MNLRPLLVIVLLVVSGCRSKAGGPSGAAATAPGPTPSSNGAAASDASESKTTDTGKGTTVNGQKGSAVEGSQLSVGAGTFSGDTDLSMKQGVTVSNDVTGAYLTMPPGMASAGPAVLITAHQDSGDVHGDTAKPMRMSVPFTLNLDTTASLELTDGKLPPRFAIVYKIYLPGGAFRVGLLRNVPEGRLAVAASGGTATVSFDVTDFGIYQATILPVDVTSDLTATVNSQIISQYQASHLPQDVWVSNVPSMDVLSAGDVRYHVQARPEVGDLEGCIIVVDRDRVVPFDFYAELASPGTAPTYEYHHVAPLPAASYQARFSCEAKSGQFLPYTDWTPAQVLTPDAGPNAGGAPAAPPPSPPAPAQDPPANPTPAVTPPSPPATTPTPAPPPPIQLTSPNGGETVVLGSQQKITWNTTGTSNFVYVSYSGDGGQTWKNLSDGTVANSGTFNWVVTEAPTTHARVKVEEQGAPANVSISAADFTIPVPTLTLTSWTTPANVPSNVPETATFTVANLEGNIEAQLSTDGGQTYTTYLGEGAAGAGNLQFTIDTTMVTAQGAGTSTLQIYSQYLPTLVATSAPLTLGHVVFVSATPQPANFGGLAAADNYCATSASVAGLAGTSFKAILSSQVVGVAPANINAKDHVLVTGPVVNVKGDLVAGFIQTGTLLWNRTLANPIKYLASGTAAAGSVWTASDTSGNETPTTCTAWTSNYGMVQAEIGSVTSASTTWIQGGLAYCSASYAFYCIAQ